MTESSESSLRRECRSALSAMQYFTRVPAPRWVGHDAEQLRRSLRYLPLIGACVGALAAAVLVLSALILPQSVAVVLAMLVAVGLTGGFHEDGLADTFDGLGATATRERALEIMKDPRVGSYGVLALIFALALKWSSLSQLPPTLAALSLIAAHAASRWCALLLVWRLPYVRSDNSSRAKPLTEKINSVDLTIATVCGLAPLLLCGLAAVPALLAALCASWLLARWFQRRLGGYTGDTLGAAQQITEVIIYVVILAAWNWF